MHSQTNLLEGMELTILELLLGTKHLSRAWRMHQLSCSRSFDTKTVVTSVEPEVTNRWDFAVSPCSHSGISASLKFYVTSNQSNRPAVYDINQWALGPVVYLRGRGGSRASDT